MVDFSTASGLNAVWLLRRLGSSHTSDQWVAFLPPHTLLRALSRHSLALSENKSSFEKLPHCLIFFTTFLKHHPQSHHRMHIIRVSLDSSLSASVATDRSRTDGSEAIRISDEREYECSWVSIEVAPAAALMLIVLEVRRRVCRNA